MQVDALQCSIKAFQGFSLILYFHCLSQRVYVLWVRSNVTDSMQDGLTGSAWGDWANYTASPLRAFENELGAQVGLVMS